MTTFSVAPHFSMANHALAAGLLAMAGVAFFGGTADAADKEGKPARVFEMRTYYAPAGKMDALLARFRNHTCKLFEKHGMELVSFWSPTDPADAQTKLVYVLAFPSKEAADRSWAAFRDDPDWKKAKADSEKDGKLVEKVESVFLVGVDFSPLK
ncbi:MAG: NIPSNAP family protein [Planctomycetia bacterium]